MAENEIPKQNRVEPDYILPFAITREEAVKQVRNRLIKGFFVPWRLKCFKTDQIKGIYLPFWIYDIFYRDSQLFRVRFRRGGYDKRIKAGAYEDKFEEFTDTPIEFL